MKVLCALVLSLVAVAPALAQAPAQNKTAKSAPRPNPIVASYAAVPLQERIAIQSDLVWTGDYNGIANGDFGERAIAAVKTFQKRFGSKQTGILNPQERAALSAGAKAKHEAAGWRVVEDPIAAVRLGIPAKIVPQSAPGTSGTRWSSARGEAQVETFRLRDVGSLAAVFELQKKEPAGRTITYNVLRPDFFVLAGLQGLKKLYVRAHIQGNEVRGVTILYDQAMEGIVDPIAVAMSSTFVPFPAGPAGPAARRIVEYATGIVVSAAGHVLTDRQATEGCNVITLAGIGGADRVGEDKSAELALLRVYGAGPFQPVALAPETAAGDVTLAGIADPQAQAGGGAVSLQRARAALSGGGGSVEPSPALGFSGAAALDAQGQLAGMTRLAAAVVAGPAGAPAAALVPVGAIRSFLTSQGVAAAPASGGGVEAAQRALLRVICVRK